MSPIQLKVNLRWDLSQGRSSVEPTLHPTRPKGETKQEGGLLPLATREGRRVGMKTQDLREVMGNPRAEGEHSGGARGQGAGKGHQTQGP